MVASNMSSPSMRLIGLWRYPLKAAGGEALQVAQLTPEGVDGDRRFMVATFGGRYLTQREHPSLATVRATLSDDGGLQLAAPGQPSLDVPLQHGPATISATLFAERIRCIDQGQVAGGWFTKFLGASDSLLPMLGIPSHRLLRAQRVSGRRAGFSDVAPLLVICDASLAALNARRKPGLPQVTLDRFRPNMLVSGCAPFEEDQWCALSIGSGVEAAVLLVDGPCPRCTVPDVDQTTGKVDRTMGPMSTLRSFRTRAGGIMFGVYMAPTSTLGTVAIGDQVQVTFC